MTGPRAMRQGPRLVVLESPYAGDTERNLAYARAALRHSLSLGEAPLASHLLYTQVLDDSLPAERRWGLLAGHAWGSVAQLCAVYADLGVSPGMAQGINVAQSMGIPVEHRLIKWKANGN